MVPTASQWGSALVIVVGAENALLPCHPTQTTCAFCFQSLSWTKNHLPGSCSREGVLCKQISIALHCQPPLEDGEGLQTTHRAFKPLILNLLPALGPNMALSIRASHCCDIKEDGPCPDPISPLLAPLQTMGQICHHLSKNARRRETAPS